MLRVTVVTIQIATVYSCYKIACYLLILQKRVLSNHIYILEGSTRLWKETEHHGTLWKLKEYCGIPWTSHVSQPESFQIYHMQMCLRSLFWVATRLCEAPSVTIVLFLDCLHSLVAEGCAGV